MIVKRLVNFGGHFKWVMCLLIKFCQPRTLPVVGFCEHKNETLSFVEGGEFLNNNNEYSYLTNDHSLEIFYLFHRQRKVDSLIRYDPTFQISSLLFLSLHTTCVFVVSITCSVIRIAPCSYYICMFIDTFHLPLS